MVIGGLLVPAPDSRIGEGLAIETLDDLFVHELRKTYSLEEELVQPLAEMAGRKTADRAGDHDSASDRIEASSPNAEITM